MISRSAVSLFEYCKLRFNIFTLNNPECFIFSSKLTTSVFQIKKFNFSNFSNRKNYSLIDKKTAFEDTFGNVEENDHVFLELPEDPEDLKEYEQRKQAQGKTFLEYIKEIKQHLQNHDYVKAIKVLEVDMVNDKKPTISYIYDILISHNAAIGDIKEAYRLFSRFKGRQGLPSGGMYTSLFNACANSKNSMLALEKADAIRKFLYEDKRVKPNISHYNVMLKAYGRHGDLSTCLKIFDEVIEKKDKIRSDTYNFLLQACISDKNSGLRHALLVWRKMLQNCVVPDIYGFNLMLRCAKECSLGDIQLTNDLVKQIFEESNKFYKKKIFYKVEAGFKKRKVLKIEAGGCNLIQNAEEINEKFLGVKNNIDITQKNKFEEFQTEANYPNFLALNPSIGSFVGFGPLTKPQERLLVLGGVDGFLKVMSEFKVKPDLKTFSLLLDLVPSSVKAEDEIISKAEEFNIKLDTCFFNILIRRRNLRKDHDSAKTALENMQKCGLIPDIITFGVLALGCTTYDKGVDLLKSATSYGFRLNKEILMTLLINARKAGDLKYVKALLKMAQENETKLNQKFILLLRRIVEEEKKKRLMLLEKKTDFKLSNIIL